MLILQDFERALRKSYPTKVLENVPGEGGCLLTAQGLIQHCAEHIHWCKTYAGPNLKAYELYATKLINRY